MDTKKHTPILIPSDTQDPAPQNAVSAAAVIYIRMQKQNRKAAAWGYNPSLSLPREARGSWVCSAPPLIELLNVMVRDRTIHCGPVQRQAESVSNRTAALRIQATRVHEKQGIQVAAVLV